MKNSVFIFTLILFSCNSKKIENNYKGDWIFAFKSSAFKSCLLESYGKDFELILAKDQSIGANFEILYIDNLKVAENLGKKQGGTIVQLPIDSDYQGKKVTLNNCLLFYDSKYLDSIADLEYKKIRLKK